MLKVTYTVTEPHPTVPQNSYTHAGRGGAGNFFRAPRTTPASGIPTPADLKPVTSNSSTSRRFYSGRGGAGNAHPIEVAQPSLSFDEEYNRAEAREQRVARGMGYHVGRGGAGNIAKKNLEVEKEEVDGGNIARVSTASTADSLRSSLSGFGGFVKRIISHN